MKSNLKSWRSIVLIVGIVVGMAVVPAPWSYAHGPTPDVVSPNENAYGMSYGDWSAAWWQWVLSIPASTSPLSDSTGESCAAGQSTGPVFFLVGSYVGTVTRTCTVPRGKAVFFPIINTECSTAEAAPFHGDNEAELRQCAGGFGDALDTRSLKVTVDGRKVGNPNSFRAQSPVFGFSVPADDNILGVSATTGSSVSDGYYVMLEPLRPGNHKIHFEGACKAESACDGFSQDVTYNIIVP